MGYGDKNSKQVFVHPLHCNMLSGGWVGIFREVGKHQVHNCYRVLSNACKIHCKVARRLTAGQRHLYYTSRPTIKQTQAEKYARAVQKVRAH